MDWIGVGGREKPAGAEDDGGGRASDIAADASANWATLSWAIWRAEQWKELDAAARGLVFA